MTAPFFHDRAAEIIAAYGGDPARWPDGERATALAVVAASPVLRAAQAEALALDAEVIRWATAPVAGGDVAAAAAAAGAARAAMRPSRSLWRWAGGTGIAAGIAAGLLLVVPHPRPSPAVVVATTASAVPVAASLPGDDATAFAQVFTPMPSEEQEL